MIIGDYWFIWHRPDSFPKLNPTTFYFIIFVFIAFCLCRLFGARLRDFFLLIFNLLFLYSFGVYHLILLLVLSFITYLFGFLLNKYKNKLVLFISIIVPLLTLIFFKYQNLLNLKQSFLIPLGISFVSFKLISYLADIYRNKIENEKNILYFLDYSLFFPTVMAGPIHRYQEFKEVISKPQAFEYRKCSNAGFLMMLGIFEKVVFCDFVASFVSRLETGDGLYLIGAIVFYSLQIYLDFDAYSNIAIACAKLLGFDINKNFNSPYLAYNLKEFWRRWHISLSTWFRDYVYIPLGGSRKGKLRQYFLVLLVFVLSGLWHGSTLNFLIWGLLHGLIRIVEDIIELPFKNVKNKFLINFTHLLLIPFNFIIVTLLWQVFKNSDLNVLSDIFLRCQNIQRPSMYLLNETYGITRNEVLWLLFICVVVLISDILRNKWDMIYAYGKMFLPFRWLGYALLIVLFLVFGVYGGNSEAADFIYQFF